MDSFGAAYALALRFVDGLAPTDLNYEIDWDHYSTPPTIGIRLVSVRVSLAKVSVISVTGFGWLARAHRLGNLDLFCIEPRAKCAGTCYPVLPISSSNSAVCIIPNRK